MAAPTIEDLVRACVAGDDDRVAALLTVAPHLARASTMFGVRPIHAAHYASQEAIVARLWVAGVKVDGFLAAELDDVEFVRREIATTPNFARAFNAGGSTALHGAVYWGALETARLLIEAGADVHAQTQDGFLNIHPLGSAVATPNGDSALDVPNPSDDEDRILALVDLLLNAGADANARREDGGTALHTAGYRGHLRVIRRLIESGADASILAHGGGHVGETPADTARAQGKTEAAALIETLARV